MPQLEYTLDDFKRDFPDDETCLAWLKENRYPDGIYCENCHTVTAHHFIESRKSYSCQDCGHHVHPTANTIFHKSRTPLTTWFYVIYQIAKSEGEISAKQIERETGVTYKTAWRMHKLVKEKLFSED